MNYLFDPAFFEPLYQIGFAQTFQTIIDGMCFKSIDCIFVKGGSYVAGRIVLNLHDILDTSKAFQRLAYDYL